jgi:hypothetical protein
MGRSLAGQRARTDAVEKEATFPPCRESNSSSSIIQSLAYSLCGVTTSLLKILGLHVQKNMTSSRTSLCRRENSHIAIFLHKLRTSIGERAGNVFNKRTSRVLQETTLRINRPTLQLTLKSLAYGNCIMIYDSV